MQLFYKLIHTPFKYPFTISGGRTKTHQPAIIVGLELGNWVGWGEAPAINYYNVSVEQMEADLLAKKQMVEKFALTDPRRYWHYLHHLFPKNPFLVCALDIAAWDLFGKMNGLPLYKIWETDWQNIPVTDYTIGIDTIDKMVEKMQQNPFDIYKIKLGTEHDIEIITSLRQYTNAVLRVDVNGGWTLEEAINKIPQLHSLGVELIEQPLAKDNWEAMIVLKENSPIPLFADESCVDEFDVERCVAAFHGINIKLTKCGGLTPALRMIEQARKLGLKVMAGSMNETSVGTAAVANLLPQLDYVDMDGPLLLDEDIADGLGIDSKEITLHGEAGLGITLKPSFFKCFDKNIL